MERRRRRDRPKYLPKNAAGESTFGGGLTFSIFSISIFRTLRAHEVLQIMGDSDA